jgi:hypothetical protein
VQQRQSILASKAELASSAAESEDGTTSDTYTAQMEAYDSQLESLDTQIAQAQAEVAKEQTESIVTYSKNTIKNGNSGQTNRLNSLTNLSANLGTTKAAVSSMNRLDREANSLKGEIAADKSRGLDTTEQEEELSTLESKAYSAAETVADSLNDINQSIIELNGDALTELDYPTPTYDAASSAASTDSDNDSATETDAAATASDETDQTTTEAT